MKTVKRISICMCLIFIVSSYADSEDYSSSKPLFCTVSQVNECIVWKRCELIDPFVANIPYFIEVNQASKTISGFTTIDRSRKIPFERIERTTNTDDSIIFSGVEPIRKGDKGELGWIMTISTETGLMTMSSNTKSSVLVVFGRCID